MNNLLANIYFILQTAGSKLRHEEKGATAVEYGIMVAGIAVVIITAVFAFGTQIQALFAGIDLTP